MQPIEKIQAEQIVERLVKRVMDALKNVRLDMNDEKVTQDQINQIFLSRLDDEPYEKEKVFGPKNRIDFFFRAGLGIEVKINKGSKMAIYRQCERYCKESDVKALLLVTGRSMGFPAEMNGKPCYYLNINKAWL